MNDIEKRILDKLKEYKSDIKEELLRVEHRLEDHEKDNNKTKEGIYNYIDEIKKEFKEDMTKEITELKETMDNDLIKPFKEIKKTGFKFIIAAIGFIFSGMIAFIIWILNVTNAMENIEKLLGG